MTHQEKIELAAKFINEFKEAEEPLNVWTRRFAKDHGLTIVHNPGKTMEPLGKGIYIRIADNGDRSEGESE